MEITEVRIKLMENSEDRLRAFCSITFDDCFVVRDLKIIEGNSGPFVAMPSRKLTSHCRSCNAKNHLKSRFCNYCGQRQANDRFDFDNQGRAKLYADIAHPVNAECRERIQNKVISEFYEELERAKQPGYVSRYDEEYLSDNQQVKRSESKHSSGGPHSRKSDSSPTKSGGGSKESDDDRKNEFGRGIH